MWRAIRETSRIPVVAALAGTAVALEHGYSEVNGVADAYIALLLALKKENRLTASMKRSVDSLNRRVEWSLQKYNQLHKIIPTSDTEWAVYRLEWMAANLKGMAFQLERQSNECVQDNGKPNRVSFEEESQLLYDTSLNEAYLDPSITEEAHRALEALLPGHKPLYKRHADFQYRITIPKRKYETVYRQLVDDVLGQCRELIPTLDTARVTQQYIDDSKLACEAWVQPDENGSPGDSKMIVNIARAISYDKAQQLAVHELTHHFQRVLMEQHLYDKCPEMRAVANRGPMGIVLEGGAEAFVELYFSPPQQGGVVNRVDDLKKRMPGFRNLDSEKVLQVERISWSGLWSTVTRIARDYQNGVIDKEECIQQMQELALKNNDSWPNADFFDQVGAYTLGYGYGKELILKYCSQQAQRNNTTVMKEYIQFMKRPLLPSQMQRSLLSHETITKGTIARYWC